MQSRNGILKIPKGGGRGGVLLGILGGGVPLGSPNPEPFSDQEISLFTPKKYFYKQFLFTSLQVKKTVKHYLSSMH